MLYIILLIIDISFCILENKYKNIKIHDSIIKTSNFTFWIMTIVIIILGIFRSTKMGYDYDSYYYEYYIPCHNALAEIAPDYDLGFYLITKLLISVCDSYFFMRAGLFALTFVPYALFVKKESDSPAYSYLLYMLFSIMGFQYGILRQALAMSLCLPAWIYIKKGKKIRGVLMICLASTIHMTALITLPAYFIMHYSEKKRLKIDMILFFAFVICSRPLLLVVVKQYQYGRYVNAFSKNEGKYQLIVYFLIILISAFILKKQKLKLKDFFDLNLWGILIQILALSLPIIGRMGNYFWLLYTVEITNNNLNKKNNQTFKILVAALLMPIYLYVLLTNSQSIVPYKLAFFD